jgi:hypothetical protein
VAGDRVTRLADLDGDRELPPHLAGLEVPTEVRGGAEYALCDRVQFDRATGLAVFAHTGLFGSIALDERTGEIVHLVQEQRRRISPTVAEFVAITATLATWLELPDAMSPSERVDSFRPVIEARFPGSFNDADGYWATLVNDITIGDYDAV